MKPPTIAPGDDQFVEFTRIESARHHDLRRAWVREGSLPETSRAEPAGRTEAARAQLAIAQELAPWDWPVRRAGIAMTGGDLFLGEEFTSFWEQWDASERPGYTPTG